MKKDVFELDVKGLKRARDNFKALRGFSGQNRSIRDAAYKALKPIEKAARANVPVKTGLLRKAIGRKKAKRAPVALVGPRRSYKHKGYHGHLVEYGTVNMDARPFMEPAVMSSKQQVSTIFQRELEVSFDRYYKKAVKL